MLNRSGLAVVAAVILCCALPNGTMAGTGGRRTASTIDIASAERSLAPIGHRQPRQIDLSPTAPTSPVDFELRRMDAEVDKKLIICRGC